MRCLFARPLARFEERKFLLLGLLIALAPARGNAQSMQLWASYRDLGSPTDKAVASQTDSGGNTYILGEATKSSGPDVVLCKVGPSGSISWTRPLTNSGVDHALALTLMPGGGATIVSSIYSSATLSAANYVRRFDASGNTVWNSSALPAEFNASVIVAAADGSLVVGGVASNRIRLIKLTSGGQVSWSLDIQNLAVGGADAVKALALDSSNSIYACGSLWTGSTSLPALMKVTSAGTLEWSQAVGPVEQSSGVALAVQIDKSLGLVDVAGSTVIGDVSRGWVAAYDPAGTSQWVQTTASMGNFGEAYQAIAMDPWNRVVVAGSAKTSPSNQDFLVARFGGNGVPVWSRTYDGPGGGSDFAQFLGIDPWGSIFVGGTVQGVSSGKDLGLLKLAPTGALLWQASGDVFYNGAAIFDGGAGADNTLTGLGLDTRGNAYVSGTGVGSSGGFDFNAVKYGLTDNAAFVDQQVPTSMVGGMGYDVTVTFRNTGNTIWSKTDGYKIGSLNPTDNKNFGFNRVEMAFTDSVPGGQNETFKFKVTAPLTAGTYNFQWRMRNSLGAFGIASATVPVTVTTLQDGTRYVSQTVPSSVKAGSTFNVSVVMRNIGRNPWNAGDYSLIAVPGYANWGQPQVSLSNNESIPQGGQKTFTIPCKAPTTPGTYKMKWEMSGPNGAFTETTTPKTITVTS